MTPTTIQLNNPTTRKQLLALTTQIRATYEHPDTQLNTQQFIDTIHALTTALTTGEAQCTCGQPMWPTHIEQWATDPHDQTPYATNVTVHCINDHSKQFAEF